jgi:hypothetical protein
LLCVRPRKRWFFFTPPEHAQTLVRRLTKTVQLPGRVLVFAPAGGFRPLAKKLAKVPGAAIFNRGS